MVRTMQMNKDTSIEERIDKLKKQIQLNTERKKKRIKGKLFFEFKPFSTKQLKIMTWWTDNSPVKNKNGIIADGAIRSGKTLSMSLSYVIWAMTTFNNQNFIMAR